MALAAAPGASSPPRGQQRHWLSIVAVPAVGVPDRKSQRPLKFREQVQPTRAKGSLGIKQKEKFLCIY